MPRVNSKRGINWGTCTIKTKDGDVSYSTLHRAPRSEAWRKARNARKRGKV